ncbi:hypothetical protein NDU88_011340 [Pleurodeles waltl]|uniref:Uncharacterized protein n=1 Tax=Pleurodeles waltl TaxID=8319 RepID=A0AAV7R2S4_PLEWA|nr:hypothetical protein NDU88_011340 [Pleurodeles waltl]
MSPLKNKKQSRATIKLQQTKGAKPATCVLLAPALALRAGHATIQQPQHAREGSCLRISATREELGTARAAGGGARAPSRDQHDAFLFACGLYEREAMKD